MSKFKDYHFKEYIYDALNEIHFDSPTTVQAKVLSKAIKGNSLMVESATGSGKTHSFMIPIFQNLDVHDQSCQAVIISPTRELAEQLYNVAMQIAKHSKKEITVAKVIGGMDRDTEVKKYEKLENINAEDWVIENCGEEVYKKIWEPLLISKFGNKKSEISMAWLWGKINLRSSSSNILTESLGYMIGSFNVLTNGLEKYLREKGCKFELGIDIKEITYTNNKKWIVNNNEFDLVLSTVAYPTTKSILKGYLNKEEEKILDSVKYTAARTMMIVLKKSLTNFYWLNIGEKDIPFGGVIEHTNLVSRDNYNNKSVVYISNYMYEDEEMYNMSKEELLKLYEPYLKNISKKFDRKEIIDYQVYDERYAQPIIEKNYSNKILPFKLKKEGLYVATMPQIYPEDRGMNYAIKIGYEVAEKIIESHKKYKL